MRAIHCGGCNRLLGMERPDGRVEVRWRRYEVLVERGEVACSQCGVSVVVAPRERVSAACSVATATKAVLD